MKIEITLTDAERVSLQSVAHRCARGVQGCATNDQYQELISRIVEALAFAHGKFKTISIGDGQTTSEEK